MILSLYIHEEVEQEGLVRNLESFARFLESMAFSHGSVLSVSDIARDCAVKRNTVDGYISILEDLLRGEERRLVDDVLITGVEQFLRELVPGCLKP